MPCILAIPLPLPTLRSTPRRQPWPGPTSRAASPQCFSPTCSECACSNWHARRGSTVAEAAWPEPAALRCAANQGRTAPLPALTRGASLPPASCTLHPAPPYSPPCAPPPHPPSVYLDHVEHDLMAGLERLMREESWQALSADLPVLRSRCGTPGPGSQRSHSLFQLPACILPAALPYSAGPLGAGCEPHSNSLARACCGIQPCAAMSWWTRCGGR